MRFVDLFAGLGGFHLALERLGFECVYASESDPVLRDLYKRNFDNTPIFGDIRRTKQHVPAHDILCAGFPCQPFSKSGAQAGVLDATRGTLFHDIIDVARKHRPKFVILENVGNFERHDSGNTWQVVRRALELLGYTVRGTEHKASGGHGLISPHQFGFAHHRERFFVVAHLGSLPSDPFPRAQFKADKSLRQLVDDIRMSAKDRKETALTAQQIECINTWNSILRVLPPDAELPAAPLWSDEFGAKYPYDPTTPYAMPLPELATSVGRRYPDSATTRGELLSLLPAYARTRQNKFPEWKTRFIRYNREWYQHYRSYLPTDLIRKLRTFPPSLRKLEWNCNGDPRNLWDCVLQFRPSGLRAKRYTAIPALVAMTTTQIPILGPKRRFLTRGEGLLLQGFPSEFELPESRSRAFSALGNAVHVDVVEMLIKELLAAGGKKNGR
jgi:DNA (cytosine-5)-methyltransferase 1